MNGVCLVWGFCVAIEHVYDEVILRARVRELIAKGELTGEDPWRVWGGPGSGEPCSVCAHPIPGTETEYEIAFTGFKTTLHFHRLCHGLWQRERRGHDPCSEIG